LQNIFILSNVYVFEIYSIILLFYILEMKVKITKLQKQLDPIG